jgi:hypothetical protein
MALAWPVTAEQVREFTDVTDPDTDASLTQAVEAVNAYVPTLGSLAGYWTTDEPPEFDPPADVIMGAIMLASRWHARRGNALGASGYQEFGASTILIQDPDIRRLLRLGPLGPFVFGAPTPVVVVEEEVV